MSIAVQNNLCPSCGNADWLRHTDKGAWYCQHGCASDESRRLIIAARPELAEPSAKNGASCGPLSLERELKARSDAEPTGLDFTRLDKGRFDVNHPPEKPVPVISLCGQGLSTPGNLTVFAAQLKAAKTSAIMAALASMMMPKGDCLGFSGAWTGGAWIHLDTEQSPFDFDKVIRIALRRAGIDAPPEWLRSYSTAHLDIDERRELFFAELERANKEHGKISGASLDGVADLCHDPNDSAECFALVARLNRAAAQFDCPIIVSLHENPGTETGKTRGHLGSELARKAETNLSLAKDADGIVTLFSERSRSVHIAKATGPRFAWDDGAGMHMSCGSMANEKAEADDFHLSAIVDEIFSDKTALRYSELKQAVMRIRHVKESAAEKTVRKLVPHFVRKGLMGTYEKA
jgi:hypothetical protein